MNLGLALFSGGKIVTTESFKKSSLCLEDAGGLRECGLVSGRSCWVTDSHTWKLLQRPTENEPVALRVAPGTGCHPCTQALQEARDRISVETSLAFIYLYFPPLQRCRLPRQTVHMT